MKLRILAVALFFTSILATGQTKVGSVNSELIVGIMPEMKNVVADLGKYAAKLDSSYQDKVKEYEEKVAAFQKLGNVSDNFKKVKLEEITSLEQGLQKSQQNGNQLIQLKRNELLRPLYKKISDAITAIAKAEGYTQILTTTGNEFAYIDENYDFIGSEAEELTEEESDTDGNDTE